MTSNCQAELATQAHMKQDHKEDWLDIQEVACRFVEASYAVEATKTTSAALDIARSNLPSKGVRRLFQCELCKFTFFESERLAEFKAITDFMEAALNNQNAQAVGENFLKQLADWRQKVTNVHMVYDAYNKTKPRIIERNRFASGYSESGLQAGCHVITAAVMLLALLCAASGWPVATAFFGLILVALKAVEAYYDFKKQERIIRD